MVGAFNPNARATRRSWVYDVRRSHMEEQSEETGASFFPRGAVAFFVTMMIVYAGVWLLIAAIMVGRG